MKFAMTDDLNGKQHASLFIHAQYQEPLFGLKVQSFLLSEVALIEAKK